MATDAVRFNDACVKVSSRAWLELAEMSFDERGAIMREIEALPEPAPVRIPPRGADRASPGIAGGVGLPLSQRLQKSATSSGESWRERV
jgi:hypothetical protein